MYVIYLYKNLSVDKLNTLNFTYLPVTVDLILLFFY